jgi:uncharacterized protein (TIGR03067 family)
MILAAGFALVADRPKAEATRQEATKLHATWLVVSFEGVGESVKGNKPMTTDQDAIQGTWKVVDATSAGAKVPNLDQLNLVFAFEGDKWTTKALDKVESRGTFALDPGKKPKTIDGRFTGEEGTQRGIYELEGDKLTLCLPDRGNEKRPSEFASTKDNKCSVFILERQK